VRELGEFSGTNAVAVACARALASNEKLDESIRETAVRVLGILGHYEDYARLYMVLAQDPGSSVLLCRRAAVHLNSRGFGELAADVLAVLARDSGRNTSDRLGAISELVKWGTGEAIAALQSLAQDETLDEAVRRRAASKLWKGRV
jgi:HEAT repeat protein